ncbi:hypothetical protein CTheo_2883 [Ceratobasidium theobromae]|uniref:Uncharacterized protein n=1 Tax=Ceratobasidium theobromae TaxID=1582974 RepID=A0A5N5QPK5_9AGAM|nr:hypothetical protein CTheo_2883 [Ceratobasidium theobromae]
MTATDSPEPAGPPTTGTSTLTRAPTIRRKSSASNLLTTLNKNTSSPASPPIRDPAPAVPETWDSQSMFSDTSGGTGHAAIVASSAGLLNTGATIPAATPGTGTSVEALQHVVQRRLQVLTMLKSSHEGHDFWFNTILLTRHDLEKVLNNTNMRKRTYRFTLLCMSLSALFEVQNTQITNPPTPSDFLRSLLGTLSEFDQFIGSGAEKAGVGMMMGLVDTEARGKMRNLFRASRAARRPGTNNNSELASGSDSNSDHSYLLFPSLPFLLDYFQVLPTFCDILIALYHKLAHLLGTNPNTTATAPFTFLPHPSPPPDASAGATFMNAPGICGTIGNIPGSDLWSLLNAGLGRDPGFGPGVGMGQMLGPPSHQGEQMQWTPPQLEMVAKIDVKVKKILSILLKELDTIARDSIRDELSSLDPLLRNVTFSPTTTGGMKFDFDVL